MKSEARYQTSDTKNIAVILISLNEGHNMVGVLENLKGWAHEVFVLDSFSKDDTVEKAIAHGAKVFQRRFTNFGDHWNFALDNLPIQSPWTMKLDPDERISDSLKSEIASAIALDNSDGMSMIRRLWFMGRPLPVTHRLTRVWRTGKCRFTDVDVNEHPIVDGTLTNLSGEIAHYDSPDLDHWYEKQNRYSTAEAIVQFEKKKLAATPNLLGSDLERRMWLKRAFPNLPFRFFLFFLHCLLVQGAWRAGKVGWIWSQLRADVMRMKEIKAYEMKLTGVRPTKRIYGAGTPDPRAIQLE